jgi:hypothetical protein
MNNQVNQQLFEELFSELPKFPETWNSEDVGKWLKIIGLEQYRDSFQEMRVDGLLILDLEEEDFEQELKIITKLHRKKIIKAIVVLKQYQEYLQSKWNRQ